MLRTAVLALILLLMLALAGCLTLEVGIERTPTPDLYAVGTLASLYAEGTRQAFQATQIALPFTPTPSFAVIQGRLCYPAQEVPAMSVYFYSPTAENLLELQTTQGQQSYGIEVPPGDYYVYAWVARYQVGGIYTRAVPCGLDEFCTDHTPLLVEASPGRVRQSIDVCDWVYPREELPGPPGQFLPDEEMD
jgi:hypothetical protein